MHHQAQHPASTYYFHCSSICCLRLSAKFRISLLTQSLGGDISVAMASKQAAAMAGAVCALVVLCLAMADGVQAQQCSMNQLSQCMGAVTRGTIPTVQCCNQVGTIADFNCFCNMMLSQRNSIPQTYINNAVRVPSMCGAQGQKLRNRQCGNVRIP